LRAVKLAAAMPKKKKHADICTPTGPEPRWVDGWPYRVQKNGTVMVGTAASGQFRRWSFALTSYEDIDFDSDEDRDQCVRLEIQHRSKGPGPGSDANAGTEAASTPPGTFATEVPSESTGTPPPDSAHTKAGHTPVAATAEPPPKRAATAPLPPSMGDQPIASRLRENPARVGDRFSESKYSAGFWSSYDLERLGSRHEQVHKGVIFACNSDPAERREGLYWLALASGPAFAAPADMVHATDQFEEGWLVVPAKWYWLEQISERGYRLMTEERLIPVSTTVRLKDIKFSYTQGGPQERELLFLSEDMHNAILAACNGSD